MSANVSIQTDGSVPITSYNFGAIDRGSSTQSKFLITNLGDTTASSLQVSISGLGANDGISYAQIAEDVSGNPGTFSAATINFGNLASGQTIYFWVKVTLPTSVLPPGNPRLFDVVAQYTGT